MRGIGKFLAVSMLAGLAAATPAQAVVSSTVVATLRGGSPSYQTIVRTILAGGGGAQINATLNAGRFDMLRTGGTSPIQLQGGTTLSDFLAFCIEPQQIITQGQSITYNVVPLSQAANNVGGIGAVKAGQIRELFGRFGTANVLGTMTSTTAAALQVAVWEISRETAGNPLNLSSGNVFFNPSSNSAAFNLAQGWLNQIDGTGPKAWNLVALQNGIMGNAGNGTQDLVAFGAVPEPASWAMLITGFGLTGASLRRRRIKAATV